GHLRQNAGVGARQNDNQEVRVFLQDLPRVLDQHRTEEMAAGDVFGEIAALSRMPRTSTIFAASDEAELLEIRWQGLRDLMRSDRKSTRLNSSHVAISYAVFCLKKKKQLR